MKTLALFPGQGSQKIGMGAELLDNFPLAAHIFEEAEDAARVPIRKLCLNGPAEDLQLTQNQQPCLLTVSTATWRVCQEEAGITADFFAGHSLGEFSALVASERLPFAEAVSLVCARGQAMQAAVPTGVGAMAAIIGGTADSILDVCESVRQHTGQVVELVNFNAPNQHILSGHQQAVTRAGERLQQELRLRVTPLPVSAPFHSSLMVAAREKMAPLIEKASFHEGKGTMIANLTGTLVDHYEPNHLIRQIDSAVLWSQSMSCAQQQGVEHYIEFGAGKVMSGLARKNLGKDIKVTHTDSIKSALESLANLHCPS
ncbi:MAG: ACP S-malonyltransferase [Zetaproteobacteria bacterium]|nr:ACP S-malonyltransferase [Zetaproteobacteria bacterium]